MKQKPLIAMVSVRCQCNTRELVDLIELVQRAMDKLAVPGVDIQIGLAPDARDRLLKHILGGT